MNEMIALGGSHQAVGNLGKISNCSEIFIINTQSLIISIYRILAECERLVRSCPEGFVRQDSRLLWQISGRLLGHSDPDLSLVF